jgi:TolA-binding protein
MNVIVGVIVDSINTSRKEIEDEDKNDCNVKQNDIVTLESLSAQISDLQKAIQELSDINVNNHAK